MSLVQQFDVDKNITLGTLGASTAIFGASEIDGSRENGFRIAKSRITMTMTGKTTAEGPLLIGVCCNVDTVAQLKSILEADPQKPSADTHRGKGTYVRFLGQVGLLTIAIPTTAETNFPSQDNVIEISYGKNGWSIPEGSALQYFAFNLGSALSSGTVFLITAEHFGVWLRD